VNNKKQHSFKKKEKKSSVPNASTHTVASIESANRKSICLQTLKVGANDRSAQELQNGL
jgi:hypothetical protein